MRFYEIDCGPGGTVWEAHNERLQYLRSYESEDAMLKDAAFCSTLGADIRFHTQGEYQLHTYVETMLENDIYG